jgi:hypothetical protein
MARSKILRAVSRVVLGKETSFDVAKRAALTLFSKCLEKISPETLGILPPD